MKTIPAFGITYLFSSSRENVARGQCLSTKSSTNFWSRDRVSSAKEEEEDEEGPSSFSSHCLNSRPIIHLDELELETEDEGSYRYYTAYDDTNEIAIMISQRLESCSAFFFADCLYKSESAAL